MGVRLGVKVAFSLLVGVIFGYVSWLILYGATNTAEFVPSSSQDIAFSLVAAGIVAFIAAQLGITVGRPPDGSGIVRRLSESMGAPASRWPGLVLILLVTAYTAVGFGFVFLWLSPEYLAVASGATELTEAPGYIAMPAKTFLGLLLGGLAGLSAGTQVAASPQRERRPDATVPTTASAPLVEPVDSGSKEPSLSESVR